MFSPQSNIEELDLLISSINGLRPSQNMIPSRWKNVLSEISDFLTKYPDECNNNKLICALIRFIAKLDSSNTQEIFGNCIDLNIGNFHSLWCTSLAIEFERSKNYILALDVFEISIQREAQPIGFLTQNLDSFKERMLKRLYGNYSLDLGMIDNNKYTYIDGGINCKNINTNLPAIPKYDFLEVINFDPSKAMEYTSPQSFSKSRSSFLAKPTNYQQNYDLSPPHFEEVEFPANSPHQFEEVEFPANNSFHEQNRSSFLSPTSQPVQKQNSFTMQAQPYEPREEIDFFQIHSYQNDQESNQNPSKQLHTNNDQSQTELSFQFNHVEPKRSIMKKSSQSPSRSNNSGVKFNNRAQPANDKKRASTPVGKNNKLEVGAKIFADIHEFHIKKQIGSGAFLAESEHQEFVIKRIPMDYRPFTPKYPFLFCLPIESITTFYVTEFTKLGTFDMIIPHIHKNRVDENVSLFYLLQLLLIVDDLETKFMTHGNIYPKKLLNKYPKDELPDQFSIDDPIWQETGIKLCACDEIHYDEGIQDRTAVARLFYFIATKSEIENDFGKPPPRWNNEIWSTTFNILQTKDPLASLIELIHNYLQKNSKKLKNQMSRTYISFSES